MFENFLNLIYPNVCGFCNKINKNSLCKKCELKLKKYEINQILDYTQDRTKYFDYCINILKYEGLIREKIIAYKFNEASYLYKTFAKIVTNNKKICEFLTNYDIILPVPMNKNKKAKRGYNQTELIAKEIAKKLNLKIDNKTLVKIKDTQTQSTLTKNKRQENVKDAFEILNKEKIVNKNIIIFDDIYTTGSTANECARTLKKAGVGNLLVLTIAKD